MLKASLFSHAMNGKASNEIVEQMKVLAARNQRAADRQILIDARRTCRIELAKAECQRNSLLVHLSNNQELVKNPEVYESYKRELNSLAQQINVLKAALK